MHTPSQSKTISKQTVIQVQHHTSGTCQTSQSSWKPNNKAIALGGTLAKLWARASKDWSRLLTRCQRRNITKRGTCSIRPESTSINTSTKRTTKWMMAKRDFSRTNCSNPLSKILVGTQMATSRRSSSVKANWVRTILEYRVRSWTMCKCSCSSNSKTRSRKMSNSEKRCLRMRNSR